MSITSSASQVDVSAGPQTFTLKVTATDDVSGIGNGGPYIDVTTPGWVGAVQPTNCGSTSSLPDEMVGCRGTLEQGATLNAQGAVMRGTWDFSFRALPWHPSAVIHVAGIYVIDAVNSFQLSTTQEMAAAGLDPAVAIVDSAVQSASSGPMAGVVTISAPLGSYITSVASAPPGVLLPADSTAVVGALSFTVTNLAVGSSLTMMITLPAGSSPTGAFKQFANGLVDVSSATVITGDTLTVKVVDGGLGDEDGVANGVIVDPVIPYRKGVGPLRVTSQSLPNGSVWTKAHKTTYLQHLLADGGNAPYRWSMISGTIPPGLRLKPNGDVTGKATAVGVYSFIVQVVDAKKKGSVRHSAQRTLTLTIT